MQITESSSTDILPNAEHGTVRPQRFAWLRRRVGFWRALIEITLISNAISLLFVIPGMERIPPTISDLIGFLSLGLYIWPAWLLAPGSGDLPRRALRIALWAILFALINGPLAWAIVTFLPYKSSFLGLSTSDLELSAGLYAVTYLFTLATFFFPARLLLYLWDLGRIRLRWRLTFSYLLLGLSAVIVLPLAMLLFLGVISLGSMPTLFPSDTISAQLAQEIAPSMQANPDPAQISALLAGLLEGRIQVSSVPINEVGGDTPTPNDTTLAGVKQISVFTADGTQIASAGDTLPAERTNELQLLIQQAFAYNRCVDGRPVNAPLPDVSICPIPARDGTPLAVIAVTTNVDSSAQIGAAFGRVIRVTLLGATVLFNITLVMAIMLTPLGLGVGYLLARGLTRRLERLTTAASQIAAGDLNARITVDTADEIGRLSENFNTMASQLAERERSLAETAARAESLLHANQRLIADVSHELRNPLATLRGYLEALEQDHGEKLPAHDMQVIQSEIKRLTGMVDELFTLARAEARQLPLDLVPTDVGALGQRMAQALAPLAQREREIELIAQIAPDLPHVSADPNRLEQVLRNLIQNALRYTPPGGIIVLAAAQIDLERVEISVADTGVGIAPEDLPQIFERFYRGDSSRARETGGAGLGLALVHELVQAMGGTVSVESDPGRGSRFSVVLPVVSHQ